MILSDRDLHVEIARRELELDPFDPDLIQPASIDVRLHRIVRVFETTGRPYVDPADPYDHTTPVDIGADGFFLQPGQFILGSTVERVRLGRCLAARLDGKSSIGRLGQAVHATAGFVDPGFNGRITLEITNQLDRPFKFYTGMKIGQLTVERLTSPADRPYGPDRGSKYQSQGDAGPQPSKAWMEFPPK